MLHTVNPEKNSPMKVLRIVAMLALLAGAVASVWLTVYTGRRNESSLLLGIFAAWVLSPYMALMTANVVSDRWSLTIRVMMYSIMLLTTAISLICYSGTWTPDGKPTAFVFLIVPLVSWILIGILVVTAVVLSRKSAGQTKNH